MQIKAGSTDQTMNSSHNETEPSQQLHSFKYFQTHFQYIQENLHTNQVELKQIKRQLTLIEDKLDRLLNVFNLTENGIVEASARKIN